ncbi:MAG: DUF58 domain-containing protein [Planctomycetota bacterium]
MPEIAEDYRKYLDPKALSKISRLELKARLIVEGFISGLHKSPYHGFSVEFAEHREYVPGDDIKHIDWKVWGRSDRFYIKQYEQETNLRSYVLLDTSESMRYGSDPDVTKYTYGCYVAASLSYLMLRQQDAVGMALFDKDIHQFVPATSVGAQLKHVLYEMDKCDPMQKTNIGMVLHNLAERITKKGLIIIISDMFDNIDSIMFGLRHLRHKKHEVLLFHILDKYERSFPFDSMTLFKGLEEYPELIADPRALKKAYLRELGKFIDELKRGCRNNKVDYVLIDTGTSLDVALTTYLAMRSARVSRGGTGGIS